MRRESGNDIVRKTAVASLTVQVVTGMVTLWGLVQSMNKTNVLLRTSLWLEIAVQCVEFAWYAWMVCWLGHIYTWTRYFDWVLSTPVMILSTTLFLLHRSGKTTFDALGVDIYLSLTLNWAMLSCGFAMEVNAIPSLVGLGFGWLFFVASFSFLGMYVEWNDDLSVIVFTVMAFLWAMYGVAASLPYEPKNVGYNILDLFSKNVYGTFLTVYLMT